MCDVGPVLRSEFLVVSGVCVVLVLVLSSSVVCVMWVR